MTGVHAQLKALGLSGNEDADKILKDMRSNNARQRREARAVLKAAAAQGDPNAAAKLNDQRQQRSRTRKKKQHGGGVQPPRACKRGRRRLPKRPTFEWLERAPCFGRSVRGVVETNCRNRLVAQDYEWTHKSVHPTVQVQFKADDGTWVDQFEMKTSKVRNAGRGLFAARSFADGEVVTRYCGARRMRSTEYTVRLRSGVLVDASGTEHFLFAHYMNHSSRNANCVLKDDGRIEAEGGVGAGDELLIDYGDESYVGKLHGARESAVVL